jgi:shikimate kinase
MKNGPSSPPVSFIFLGLKHSGKTSLGQLLAKDRNLPFVDLDEVLLEVHRELALEENGAPAPTVREIYRRSPELFRRCETLAARQTAQRMKKQSLVLAAGGGSMDNAQAMAAWDTEELQVAGLNKDGPEVLFIYLKTGEAELFERITREGIPPFLEPDNQSDPQKVFAELYKRRSQICEEKADLTINMDGLSLHEGYMALKDLLDSLLQSFTESIE